MRPGKLLSSVLLVTMALVGMAPAQEAHVAGLTGNAHHGKQHYRRYCIGCHGVRGDGTGENAPWMDPKPRDFTAATFKCRSTPTGTLPTDDDLYKTIGRGVHASGMPSWIALTKQQRADLVAYVKSFSKRWVEEKPGTPVVIPPETANDIHSTERGGELFQKMNCWSCHGKQGRGNGPSSIGLTDSKGYPITPYDFTSATQFKCGDNAHDLFQVLMTGLDGTPMPSFSDAMDSNQLWDIVHYVETFRSKQPRQEQLAQRAAANGGSDNAEGSK